MALNFNFLAAHQFSRNSDENCGIRVSFHAISISITESRLRQKREEISTFPNKQCVFKVQFSSYTPIFAQFRQDCQGDDVSHMVEVILEAISYLKDLQSKVGN